MDNNNELRTNYNKTSEQNLQNRINPYNLNNKEKEQVWQITQKKEKAIQFEKDDYKNNWEKRFKSELDRLKKPQKPELKHDYKLQKNKQNTLKNTFDLGGTKPRMTDIETRQTAWNNVKNNHLKKRQDIKRAANKDIDKILDNARQEGRGPKPKLQQEFKRTHDHNKNREQDRTR